MNTVNHDPDNRDLYIGRVREKDDSRNPQWIVVGVFDAVQDLGAEHKAHEAVRAWLMENWPPYSWWFSGGSYDGQYQSDEGAGSYVPAIVDHQENTPESRERKHRQVIQKSAKRALTAAIFAAVKGFRFTVKPELVDEWTAVCATNEGDSIFGYACYWGWLMEQGMAELDVQPVDAEVFMEQRANELSREANLWGMSGASKTVAVRVLVDYWIHGEALRRWHNRLWRIDDDQLGIVDPSIITRPVE